MWREVARPGRLAAVGPRPWLPRLVVRASARAWHGAVTRRLQAVVVAPSAEATPRARSRSQQVRCWVMATPAWCSVPSSVPILWGPVALSSLPAPIESRCGWKQAPGEFISPSSKGAKWVLGSLHPSNAPPASKRSHEAECNVAWVTKEKNYRDRNLFSLEEKE